MLVSMLHPPSLAAISKGTGSIEYTDVATPAALHAEKMRRHVYVRIIGQTHVASFNNTRSIAHAAQYDIATLISALPVLIPNTLPGHQETELTAVSIFQRLHRAIVSRQNAVTIAKQQDVAPSPNPQQDAGMT